MALFSETSCGLIWASAVRVNAPIAAARRGCWPNQPSNSGRDGVDKAIWPLMTASPGPERVPSKRSFISGDVAVSAVWPRPSVIGQTRLTSVRTPRQLSVPESASG